MSSVKELKNNKEKRDKGNIITDADYTLRDKKAERKDTNKSVMNTRNITDNVGIHAKEIAKIKEEARAKAQEEVKAEILTGDFIKDLKAQLKAEMGGKTQGGK